MNSKHRIPTRWFPCPWLVMGILLALGGWASGQVERMESDVTAEARDLKARLRDWVAEYQAAQAIEDPVQRKAAFRAVEIAFSSLLDQERASGRRYSADLFVTWGNAAVQVNDRGKAVLAYRQALRRDPFHPQARRNLEYLRAQLPDWAQNKSSGPSTWQQLFFWKIWLSPEQIHALAAGLFAGACALWGSALLLHWYPLRLASGALLLVWAVVLISTWLDSGTPAESELVFVAEETPCHTADSLNSPLSINAQVPAGAEATLVEERNGWYQVNLGNGQEGWVPASSARRIE